MKKYFAVLIAVMILSACLLAGCSETFTVTYMFPKNLADDKVIGKEIVSAGSCAGGLLSVPEITVDGVTYVFASWSEFSVGEYGTKVNADTAVYAKYNVKRINVSFVYVWDSLIDDAKANEVPLEETGVVYRSQQFNSGAQIIAANPAEYTHNGNKYAFVNWQKGLNDRVVYNLTATENDIGVFVYAGSIDIRIYAYMRLVEAVKVGEK